MIRKLFAKGPTTKTDVIFAVAGALAAIWKAQDTIKEYRQEAGEKEQNQ